MSDTAWYVIRLGIRAESKVLSAFKDMGIDCYIPHETRWLITQATRRQPKRRASVTRPILPGYGFVNISEADFYRVKNTDGVTCFLMRGDQPATIKGFPDEMRSQERAGLFDFTQERQIRFEAGQDVRITKGAYAGLVGRVIKARGHARVAIVMKGLFGGDWPLTAPVSDLEHVTALPVSGRKAA